MSDFVMEVVVLNESGYEQALKGLAFNKHKDINEETIEKVEKVARRLAPLGKGHNKFLEHIYVWLEVNAPRYFWQEADTYRMSSKQSEGTRDILKKQKGFDQDNFEHPLPESYLKFLNEMYATKNETLWKSYMPEGYIQRREWCMSYKTIKNIIEQRWHHPLPHWNFFCKEVLKQIQHWELLA